MLKEGLKESQKRPDEKNRAKTVVVKGTITDNQRDILQKLVGIMGSNEQDVVGKILTLWLYNEGFLKINKLEKKGDK
ncbi:MAG: hypothetical protein WC867_07060 [Candidatus Pacearchaeota archaeon]|jgi:hypothetical protein